MLHKGKNKEEIDALPAAGARLLKPWIWGEEFRRDEAAKMAPASNGGKQQLDLNAPLLSVRRNRNGDAARDPSSANPPNPSSSSSARIARRSSSFSQEALVPFFTWELPPAPPPPPIDSLDDRGVTGDGGDLSGALVLTPPPETTSKRKARKERESFLEFADARSEFAHTETLSIAPTYTVSDLVGEGDGGEWDYNEEEAMAMVEYNSSDREMILERFLPAAKAVALEMAQKQQQQRDLGRPLIAHPSPQGHQYRRVAEEQQHHRHRQEVPRPRPEKQKEKKSFGELIKMHGDGGNTRMHPRTSGDLRNSEGGDGDLSSQRYTTVVGSVCGFFPLLRMIQASAKEAKRSSPRRARASKQKLEPERENLPGEDDGDESSSSTEWWSDEGGDGDGGVDENDLEVEDASSEFSKNSSYLSCRYTPSRGGLKSPAMVESKGFLGMPRDRRVGSTFIKRMYPIVKSDSSKAVAKVHENTMSSTINAAATSNPTNGHESDSSESLTSIRLSRVASRQNSDGGGAAMEKVFCLDTLDQMRQGVFIDHGKTIKSSWKKGVNSLDERGIHPAVVIPDESVSSMGSSKQRVEEDRLLLYVPSKAKITASSTRPSKNNPGEAEDREDHDGGGYKSPSNVRICRRESDCRDGSSIVLPVPRGPSQSWLTEKLVKAPGKPPLARRNLLVSTGKSANF